MNAIHFPMLVFITGLSRHGSFLGLYSDSLTMSCHIPLSSKATRACGPSGMDVGFSNDRVFEVGRLQQSDIPDTATESF